MRALQVKLLQLKALGTILRHFENPWLIVLLRLGIVFLPYFVYRIHKDGRRFQMLARPARTSMADLFVLREVLVDETYKEVLNLLPKKNIRLVDIGANLGSFTIWMHHTVGVREAFCFEPEPDSFRLLAFNLSKNGCDGAQALHLAVGGKERTVEIALKQNSPGGTHIYGNTLTSHGHTIRVVSFQDWLGRVDRDFDILKMDCEGAEWEIVASIDATKLARFSVVVTEVHADPQNRDRDVNEFPSLMEALGFRTVRWDGHAQGLYIGAKPGHIDT